MLAFVILAMLWEIHFLFYLLLGPNGFAEILSMSFPASGGRTATAQRRIGSGENDGIAAFTGAAFHTDKRQFSQVRYGNKLKAVQAFVWTQFDTEGAAAAFPGFNPDHAGSVFFG